MSRGANAYRKAQVESAPPTRLLDEMYQRLEDDLRDAAAHMAARDIAGKSRAIDHALAILSDLDAALDRKAAPELCARLSSLYHYATNRIMASSLRLDPAPLVEVERLLSPVRDAFRTAAASQP